MQSTLALRYSSGHQDCAVGDMTMFPISRSSWHPLGRRIGALGLIVYKPYSRGSVTLRSADPADAPAVQFRLLSDRRDFDRLADGLVKAARTLRDVQSKGVINEVFVVSGRQVSGLNRPSPLNWLKSVVVNLIFDLPFGVRRRLLRRTTVDLHELEVKPSLRDDCVRRFAAAVHHPAGTCKIGRPSDPTAVVDPRLRVYGMARLRIADASVMPSLPAAGPHLPVLMIGEKAAAIILEDHSTKTLLGEVGAADL
jgi:5-(hydroxymethyl)furfural/furfural oxidase